ncbi:hypothetical protein JMJ35_009988 [Cladonia borealis]|uniref:Ecp2 effector protein domain-containing protein n=1 Tax=Cladonia borealis TaxID=184061 RepID=A0AA39V653_9LECA|nr:hypothetical protein JMJ35_009988 [Cladonia borealis]
MVWMKKISTLLLLYSLSLRAVALTLSLNSTRTACRKTEVWVTPQWTSSVSYNCKRVIETLSIVEPESLLDDLPFGHQFLPLGQEPEYPTPDAVRTPWKLTNGPCTMAVTTLAQIPLGYLPLEVGRGPFPDNGYSSWYMIRQKLLGLIEDCVANGEGGMKWFQPEPREWDPSPKPAVGVFFYATDSEIDRAIGPKTNTALILLGTKFTVSSSIAISNSTS